MAVSPEVLKYRGSPTPPNPNQSLQDRPRPAPAAPAGSEVTLSWTFDCITYFLAEHLLIYFPFYWFLEQGPRTKFLFIRNRLTIYALIKYTHWMETIQLSGQISCQYEFFAILVNGSPFIDASCNFLERKAVRHSCGECLLPHHIQSFKTISQRSRFALTCRSCQSITS